MNTDITAALMAIKNLVDLGKEDELGQTHILKNDEQERSTLNKLGLMRHFCADTLDDASATESEDFKLM